MENKKLLKLAIPKGRLYDEVIGMLEEAGFKISKNGRNYRPYINDEEIEVKIFKPQNIPKLVEQGSQDIAFTGFDWVVEQKADVKEILNLELNSVKIVAAIPDSVDFKEMKKGKIRVASEYNYIAKNFLEKEGIDYDFIKAYGATEVFIPEDADMIIDNTSTGRTLKDNKLKIIKEVMTSSTRIIANKGSMKDDWKQKKIENFLLLMKSILEGRKRLLIEMNVENKYLDRLISVLPSMKSPTVSKLYNDNGYAIKIAVDKKMVGKLIPNLKDNGATDILVFNLRQVIS